MVRAAKFVLVDEALYKRGFSKPYLRCLTPDESHYVLRDIHEGACGNHLGARSFVYKIVCARYYWPSMQANAIAYFKACDKCQRYSNIPRQPSEYLTPMVAPWPFAQWGLDILGPFPMGTRQMKFLVVAIDYFTKRWKQSLWQESLSRMSEVLFGRTQFAASEFLECPSLTMDANLTIHPSENFLSGWRLGIITPHPPTHKLMDKLKLQIDYC